jgi:hypothetical protein
LIPGVYIWVLVVAGVFMLAGNRRSRGWLTSMKTAIILLTIIAAFSMAGVLIGQNLPTEAYVERHGAGLGGFIVRSGLADVFGAWYFLVAVAALTLSIIVCSVSRVARIVRTAKRARLAKLGSLVTHLSIAVVMAGGLVTALSGFRYPAERFLSAGDEMLVAEGDFTVRVDAARTEFNEEGKLSEYVSEVTVIEDGREVFSRRIEVNEPLVHNGVGLYQYEMLPSATSVKEVVLGVMVLAEGGEGFPAEVAAPLGVDVEVPGTDLSVKVLEFLAHFTYDIERGTAELASVWHDNPAVLVQVAREGEILGEKWVFMSFPAHGGDDLPCRLVLLDYWPDHDNALTRFEIASQPGTPLLFGGFAAMSLGLMLTFWTRRPRQAAERQAEAGESPSDRSASGRGAT